MTRKVHTEVNLQMPIFLFRSRQDAEWESEVTRLPACRRTAYDADHVEKADQFDGGMQGEDMAAMRDHIAEETPTDIHDLETRHAVGRRRQRALGCQTHGVEWMNLVADVVMDNYRKFAEDSVLQCYWEVFPELLEDAGDNGGDDAATIDVLKKRPAAKKTQKPVIKSTAKTQPKAKAKKAPGPFRIFTKEVTGGTKGFRIPNMEPFCHRTAFLFCEFE